MKPTLVADEMFPEGAGPYMDIEEVRNMSESPIFMNPKNHHDLDFPDFIIAHLLVWDLD